MDPKGPQAALLHRISSLVSSEATLESVLQELIALTAKATDCDACLVYLWDAATGEMVLRASQLPHSAEIGQIRLRIGEGVTGWVAQHESVVALAAHAKDDARQNEQYRYPELARKTGLMSLLSVPLLARERVIGTINIYSREPRGFSDEEVGFVRVIAGQAPVAIENARLMTETIEMKRALETRKPVERAKGILQARHKLTEQEAYLRLRNKSRRMRRAMRELAEAIILAEDFSPPGPVPISKNAANISGS